MSPPATSGDPRRNVAESARALRPGGMCRELGVPAASCECPELVRYEAERRHEKDGNGLRTEMTGPGGHEREQAHLVRRERHC